MTTEITIPYNFTPRTYQQRIMAAVDGGVKRAIAVYHRRAGKDLTFWQIIIKLALTRKGLYYYSFPQLGQARRVIWTGIDGGGTAFLDYIPEALIEKKDQTEMKIFLINGSIIQLMGTDTPDKWRGSNPVGVVFSEMAFQSPLVWDIVRPILAENEGIALFNSTPNGKNHFYDMVENAKVNDNWFCDVVTVEDSVDESGNRYVTKEAVDAEIAAGMSAEMVQAEFYCSFVANSEGYFYLRALETLLEDGRRGEVPYRRHLPVHVFFDIGVSDSTAIWFVQEERGIYYVIDFYEANGKSLPEYMKILQDKDYVYGSLNFPHDIKQTELGTGRTRLEVISSLAKGIRLNVLPKLAVQDGIDAVRAILPFCSFDEKKTKQGFYALQNYHRKYDRNKKQYVDTPVHDWSSHAADGFRYFAIGITNTKPKEGRFSKRLKKHMHSSARSSWRTA